MGGVITQQVMAASAQSAPAWQPQTFRQKSILVMLNPRA
jgi:hypothetical protein